MSLSCIGRFLFICVYELGINKCVTLEDDSTENPNFKIMQICKILGGLGKFLDVTPQHHPSCGISYLTWDWAPRPPASRILLMSSHPSSVALFSALGLKATSRPAPLITAGNNPSNPSLQGSSVWSICALSGGKTMLIYQE